MRLKSYFAGTVEAAMRLARHELGEEAMLMSSRKSPPESQHLGQYEVVFATDGSPADAPAPETPADPSMPRLAGEIAEMRRQLDRITASISRTNLQRPGYIHPSIEEVCAALTAADVEPELILGLTRKMSHEALASSAAQARIEFTRHLSESVAVAPEPSARGRRIIALIGPPGVGKTSTLVKLAARQALAARRPARILSIDNNRIGAVEQLRSYAAILGLGFEACETAGELALALDDRSRGDLFFVDTPGFGPRDLHIPRAAAGYFSSRGDVETHLVLSCASKSSDLTQVVERFAIFRPSRLLFTRLDETNTFGAILNLTAVSTLPVSYLGFGQQVPEDIEPATANRIVDLVLRGKSALPFEGSAGPPVEKVTTA